MPTVGQLTARAGLTGRATITGDAAVVVTSVTLDSRSVEPGALFCCIPGERTDGHRFAAAAVARGAVAVLVERRLDVPVTQVRVDSVRAAVGPLAAELAGRPSEALTVVGITGTNGKTTTAHLLAAILDRARRPAGVFGTLDGSLTTPEAPELQARLAAARAARIAAVVMEVSSHALDLHRVDGTRFAAAVFTNLGRDHHDFHGSTERYFAAKARLFTAALSDMAVINLDDVHGRLLADTIELPVHGFSEADLAAVHADAVRHEYRWRGTEIVVPIGGRFNVANSHAAATTAAALGIGLADISAGLAEARPVPGRFEAVAAGQDFGVVVDYAHTPDGLRAVLGAARHAAPRGKVIVVFGCGGDRDPDKRAAMGAVAGELADRIVLTSDNPRSEDPDAIIAAILAGVGEPARRRTATDRDRRAAIASALDAAAAGDIVVIAGKGHETTQTVGSAVRPFDDRAVVRELLGGRR